MIARHRLPDCPTFRQMWMDRANRNKIADVFGVTVVEVSDLAKTYGYPKRSTNRLVPEGPMPARKPGQDPKRLSLGPHRNKPVLPANKAEALAGGRWDTSQIVAVFRTGGRYSELADLAGRWGVSVTALVGLWHRVRIAA